LLVRIAASVRRGTIVGNVLLVMGGNIERCVGGDWIGIRIVDDGIVFVVSIVVIG
jgi:hypothetical protein